MIYLDTHVVIWLYEGDEKLFSLKARKLIQENELVISPMVSLELQYLYESKRLIVSASKLLETTMEDFGVAICEKDMMQVVQESIKQSWTRDPFDRMITAQASITKDTLLTKDRTILNHYKKAAW